MNNAEHIKDTTENGYAHETQDSLNQTPEQKALQQCQLELQEWKDRFLRTSADFENFKRREEKTRLQVTRYAQIECITGLLPIVDNFERALKQKKQEEIPADLKSWFEGIILIDKDLQKYFATIGLEEIKEKNEFDPQLHEAVMTVESTTVSSGHIVDVLQKGYRFKDFVVRPAKVSIAQ